MARRPTKAECDRALEHVLDLLAYDPETGRGLSLREACRKVGIVPATVYNRCDRDADYAARYARARELRADLAFEEILDTARQCTPTDANAVRVKVDALKWAIARMSSRYRDAGPADAGATPDERVRQTREAVRAMAALDAA